MPCRSPGDFFFNYLEFQYFTLYVPFLSILTRWSKGKVFEKTKKEEHVRSRQQGSQQEREAEVSLGWGEGDSKCHLPGANTWDPTPNKAIREKTWRARRIRFSGVSKRPAHEIPPMTRSRGESLIGKADQVFRDFEKLPPGLTLKMISVFLMPASIDYSLISLTQAGRLSPISSQIRINLEL